MFEHFLLIVLLITMYVNVKLYYANVCLDFIMFDLLGTSLHFEFFIYLGTLIN